MGNGAAAVVTGGAGNLPYTPVGRAVHNNQWHIDNLLKYNTILVLVNWSTRPEK